MNAYVVALALVAAAVGLAVAGVAAQNAGVEFGALALILAAWLVRDSARAVTPTEPGERVM